MKMDKQVLAGGSIFLVVAFLLGLLVAPSLHIGGMDMGSMNMAEKSALFVSLKENIQDEHRAPGNYQCCLLKPCMYCIEKDPKHGVGSTCTCLEDIVNGVHPCGECIGEIMEGHGNPYLSKYFAASIAEEMGEQHLDVLRQMMFEKYDIPIEEQD